MPRPLAFSCDGAARPRFCIGDAAMLDAFQMSVRLADLLRREQGAMADFLVALADFDRSRLWLDLGHPGLFSFLHRELGLSKGAAHYRKTAAQLIQRFPEVVEPLRDGRLCISAVIELAKVLTVENRGDVLPRFFHRSKREAAAVAAEIQPLDVAPHRELITVPRSVARSLLAPADRESLRGAPAGGAGASTERPAGAAAVAPESEAAGATAAPLPGPGDRVAAGDPASEAAHSAAAGQPAAAHSGDRRPAAARAVQPVELLVPRDSAEPLTANLRRLHVTVSRRFVEKLEMARAALSHSHPDGGAEEILEAGLDLLLARHASRRGLRPKAREARRSERRGEGSRRAGGAEYASSKDRRPVSGREARRRPGPAETNPTAKGRPSAPAAAASASAHGSASGVPAIPAAVKRKVWRRDEGRCQWPLAGGGICGSTLRVEFDHVVPRARGGPSAAGNLRLLCRIHNQLAARQVFGDAWMDRFAGPVHGTGSAPANARGGSP